MNKHKNITTTYTEGVDDLDKIVDDSEDIMYNECEDDLSMPLNGSPLTVNLILGDSAKPMSQNQFPSSESTGNDIISSTWLGIHGFFNP